MLSGGDFAFGMDRRGGFSMGLGRDVLMRRKRRKKRVKMGNSP